MLDADSDRLSVRRLLTCAPTFLAMAGHDTRGGIVTRFCARRQCSAERFG